MSEDNYQLRTVFSLAILWLVVAMTAGYFLVKLTSNHWPKIVLTLYPELDEATSTASLATDAVEKPEPPVATISATVLSDLVHAILDARLSEATGDGEASNEASFPQATN